MTNELNGKVLAVIGASSGIGQGIVRAAAEHSLKGIVLAARSVDKLEALAREIEGKGLSALVVPTDVTKPEAIKNLIAKTMEKYGALDYLVNSAGVIQGAKEDHELTPEERHRILATNYHQVLNSAPSIASHMLQQKSGVYIVISSHAASKHFAGQATYCSSKAGASSVALTMDAQFEIARKSSGHPIYAFTLEPGFINTPEARAQFPGAEFQALIERSPTPQQFGSMVTEYMISPEKKHADKGARHIIETV